MDFHKAITLVGLLASAFLLAACDSSANTDASPPAPVKSASMADRKATLAATFDYELRTEEYSMQDDRFPFGYWEIIRVYPEVVSADQPAAASAVNERISTLVGQFGCDGMGDESFHTREIYLDNGLLSMTYEATWTCATMQAPDGRAGFLNLDLASGSELTLDEQFQDRYAYERFQKSALEALNDALEDQVDGRDLDCPEITELSGFYTDGTELWVAALAPEHGMTHCDVRTGFLLTSLQDQLKPHSPLGLAVLR